MFLLLSTMHPYWKNIKWLCSTSCIELYHNHHWPLFIPFHFKYLLPLFNCTFHPFPLTLPFIYLFPWFWFFFFVLHCRPLVCISACYNISQCNEKCAASSDSLVSVYLLPVSVPSRFISLITIHCCGQLSLLTSSSLSLMRNLKMKALNDDHWLSLLRDYYCYSLLSNCFVNF